MSGLIARDESAPGVYWEVHCRAEFAIPRERVADLFAEVNGKAWLVKACEFPVSEKGNGCVAFCYGINLAGGVTPNHLKSQIFEWLEKRAVAVVRVARASHCSSSCPASATSPS